MSERARVRVVVRGRVQGVAFRAATLDEARRIGGLFGWVKNLPDRSVEVLAEGELAAVEALLAWCRHGPPAARVEGVEETWLARGREGSSFVAKAGGRPPALEPPLGGLPPFDIAF
jgi:acylphosphatase